MAQQVEPQVGAHRRNTGRRVRSASAVLLMVVGTVLAVLAPVAVWGRNVLLDTDRYVRTMAPLAADSSVQDAIVIAIDRQFAGRVDVAAVVRQTLPPAVAAVLAAPLQHAVAELVHSTASEFVQSDRFRQLWVEANRRAHGQLVRVLTGQSPDDAAVAIIDDAVTVDVSQVVAAVKAILVEAGFDIARNVPDVGATVVIAQIEGVDRARDAVRWLDRVANVVPFLAVLCFAGAVAVAQRRRRALLIGALCVAGAMLVLGLGLIVARTVYLDQRPGTVLSREGAASVFDTVVRYLRLGIRAVLGGAVAVAVVAWLAGARGPMLARILDNRVAAAIAIIGLAGIVLVFWPQPTFAVAAWVAVAATGLAVAAARRQATMPANGAKGDL